MKKGGTLISILWVGLLVNSNLAQLLRETSSCEQRQTPGFICQSCDLIATCIQLTTGWMTVPVDTCNNDAGSFCNTKTGACSSDPGACNPTGYEANFVCTSEGVFPDPYDCQKYHICNTAAGTIVATEGICEGSSAYDVASGECSLAVDSPVCKVNQFACERAGDVTPWPGSTTIFYICKASGSGEKRILYPSLYQCAPGEIFDKFECKKTTTPPISPPDTTCKAIGLFPNPSDCRSYHRCIKIGGPFINYTCPPSTHFLAASSSCVMGAC